MLEQLKSHTGLSLDRLFEKFTNNLSLTDDGFGKSSVLFNNLNNSRDALFDLSNLTKKANEYREKFKLSNSLSVEEVFVEVKKRSENLKVQNAHNKKVQDLEKTVKNLKKKEVVKDVKKETK